MMKNGNTRHGHNSIFNLLPEVSFCCFFHFNKNHGWNFFSLKDLLPLLQVNFDARFALFVDNFEREHFQIALNIFVRISGQVKRKRMSQQKGKRCLSRLLLSPNQSFSVKNGSCWIGGGLIFCSISDQTLSIRKCNVRWSNPIALVICNYFNFPVNVCSDARVRGTQIDSDHGTELFTGVVGERW